MHIARKVMQFVGPDGLTYVQPGDAVPDFMSWPYPLRRAHLNTGAVEEVGAHHSANLTTEGGSLRFMDAGTDKGPTPEVSPESLAPEDMQPTLGTEDAALVETGKEAEDLPPEAFSHTCLECGRGFSSKRYLQKHQRRHK